MKNLNRNLYEMEQEEEKGFIMTLGVKKERGRKILKVYFFNCV